jgi:hypothetical protein
MERAIKDNVQLPSKLGVEISESAENAIMNAMNVRIVERTQTAGDFINALKSDDVQRVAPVKVKDDLGKFPLWLKIASATLGAVIAALGVLIASGVISLSIGDVLTGKIFQSEKVNAPGVVNMLQDEAMKILEDSSLILQVQDLQFSDKVAKDKIMLQNPLSGRLVEKGSPVFVTVSNGTEAEYLAAQEAAAAESKVNVPNLVGMRETTALETLEDLGLRGNVTERRKDDRVAAGGVISQMISGGTAVDPDTVVGLVISLGRDDVQGTPPLERIAVASGPSKTSYYVGDSLNTSGLAIRGYYDDGSNKSLSGWSCSPTRLSSAGTQTITVSYQGKTTSFTVSVSSKPADAPKPAEMLPDSVSLNYSNITLDLNGDTARTLNVSTSPDNAVKALTWASTNSSVATVSVEGTITAHAVGSATIIVETSNGKKASCVVTVTNSATVE